MAGLWNLIPVQVRWGLIAFGAVVVVGSLLGSYAWTYHQGVADEAAKCTAAAQAARISWLELQLAIARDASTYANRQAEELAGREMTLQTRLNDYEKLLADGRRAACDLTDDDVAGLHNLTR